MMLVSIVVLLALIGIALITVVNAFFWQRLGEDPRPSKQPMVSILIPARNEAAVIDRTVRSLLVQTYFNLEIIVLDDNSSDGTADVVQSVAGPKSRLRVVSGSTLPPPWLGKNWACHQLAQLARGEILIFTDADVSWAPHAVSALVAKMDRTQADLLTIWPTQQTQSWAERLTVPLMALVVIGYLPLPLVHYTRWPMFAAANGQCLAFRRQAYELIKGHTTVCSDVLEDVILSRRVKRHGLSLRMADGAGLVNCRMYKGWPAVRDGFAKNILAGYGGRVSFLILATVFHWLVFFGPWLWLALGWLDPGQTGWPRWPLLLVGLGVGTRALTAALSRQRVGDALLMPVSVLLMTRIAAQAIWWQWRYGGPRWKGRLVSPTPAAAEGRYG
jgi:chlorobactene glucosyltransferase